MTPGREAYARNQFVPALIGFALFLETFLVRAVWLVALRVVGTVTTLVTVGRILDARAWA
ncbi:MAG: hypothetical protein H7338_09510 [Candidatus Sericytochromatia bacterium]|nr:hypothetical protein [Candidatus Sericytochromatia bacterium]